MDTDDPECTCTWGPIPEGPGKAIADAIGATEELVKWDPACPAHHADTDLGNSILEDAETVLMQPWPSVDEQLEQAAETMKDDLPCPHARPSWRMCPWCLGINKGV